MVAAKGARARLSVAVLARNEEQSIAGVLQDILAGVQEPFEILVVDDSIDATPRIVRGLAAAHPCIRLVSQCGKGYTAAFATAVRSARGDAIVVLVADSSDDATDIERMRGKIEEGYDLVCASRYRPGGASVNAPVLQSVCSRLVSKSLQAAFGIPTSDVSNSFKMYRTSVVRSMTLRDSGYATSMQVTLKCFFNGDRITEIPTVWRNRRAGSSKFLPLRQGRYYLCWYLWAVGRRACFWRHRGRSHP